MIAQRLFLVTSVVLAACNESPAEPEVTPFRDAELTVLFIGNSLTAANNLPALVGTIADQAGRTFDYRMVVHPNFSLEDHWFSGAAGWVNELRPDVVVLQQGPSSVGSNPDHLRRWTETFASVVEEAGGRPALLMVWPERTRTEAFDAVRESYRGAAEAVDGIFIPAGEAWRTVWDRDPAVSLYSTDGFHPSLVGSFVAALTVFEVLFDHDVRGLPPLLGNPERAELLYEAVHATVVATTTPAFGAAPRASATQTRPRTPQR